MTKGFKVMVKMISAGKEEFKGLTWGEVKDLIQKDMNELVKTRALYDRAEVTFLPGMLDLDQRRRTMRFKNWNLLCTVGIEEVSTKDQIEEIGLYNLDYLKEAIDLLDDPSRSWVTPHNDVRVVRITGALAPLCLLGFQTSPTIAPESYIVIAPLRWEKGNERKAKAWRKAHQLKT